MSLWHYLLQQGCFHLCPFVGWLVCQQDYSKTTKWWMGLCPEQTLLTFAVDLDKVTDPGFFFSLALTFFDICVNFSGKMAWILRNIKAACCSQNRSWLEVDESQHIKVVGSKTKTISLKYKNIDFCWLVSQNMFHMLSLSQFSHSTLCCK